jgi:hypothetical protein
MPNITSPSNRQPRSPKVDWRLGALGLAAVIGALAFVGYYRARDVDRATAGSASERLQPLTARPDGATVRRTVYVPVYSSLYLGLDIKRDIVELASTLSIRNVSPRHAIVLESVRYFDSGGHLVRDHLSQPAKLGTLSSVEFVVKQSDTTGGPGANFLVGWSGPSQVDEPLIEAIMLGRQGNAGISFTSMGRTITNDTPE